MAQCDLALNLVIQQSQVGLIQFEFQEVLPPGCHHHPLLTAICFSTRKQLPVPTHQSGKQCMTNYMGKRVKVGLVVKEYSFFPSSYTITTKVKISVVLYQKQETYLLQNNAGQHPPTYLLQLVPCIRSKLQSRKENSTPISCVTECFMYKLETVNTLPSQCNNHKKHTWNKCTACCATPGFSAMPAKPSTPYHHHHHCNHLLLFLCSHC
jgi:hypothetical protein